MRQQIRAFFRAHVYSLVMTKRSRNAAPALNPTIRRDLCSHGSPELRALAPVRRRLVAARRRLVTVQPRTAGAYKTVRIFSACYGEVPVPCYDFGNGSVALLASVPGAPGQPAVTVMAIDAQRNRLDAINQSYSPQVLATKAPTQVSIATCRSNAALILQLEAKTARTAKDRQALHNALVYNTAVDVQFLSCKYLEFLHEVDGLNTVGTTNLLASIHNVPNLENAFFTGDYMVYGNGERDPNDPQSVARPLGVVDVCGHELGHGVVEKRAGISVYQGHAGAINESYADNLGYSFENWLYAKLNGDADPTNDIRGVPDALMGEDCGFVIRNLADPGASNPPQPSVYRGQYWANPNLTTEASDYGGVHQNNGVGNSCYYRTGVRMGLPAALKLYLRALTKLGQKPSYLTYRDSLKAAAAELGVDPAPVTDALLAVGLGPAAVSDWTV
jgi:Zn-dependent metalloprotease